MGGGMARGTSRRRMAAMFRAVGLIDLHDLRGDFLADGRTVQPPPTDCWHWQRRRPR